VIADHSLCRIALGGPMHARMHAPTLASMHARMRVSTRASRLARGCACALACALACEAARAQGGAFSRYDLGLPNQGESFAGMSAIADDAGTAFTNPAGMMRLHGNHVMFGGAVTNSDVRFQPGAGTNTIGGDGGNAGGTIPSGGVYVVVSPSDEYRVGLSVNSPFASRLSYADDWSGRYFIQEFTLETVNIRPSMATRVNDKLSISGGADFCYLNLDQHIALNEQLLGLPDGRFQSDQESWRLGWDLGALYELTDDTRVGLTYHSRLPFKLKGHADVEDPGGALASTANISRVDSKFIVPQGVDLGLHHDLSASFALLFDAGWTDWSAFEWQPTALGPEPPTVARNWHDTYRGALGARYRVSDDWLLQAGYSYDSSPVSDANRTPELPFDEQHRVSVGVQHALAKDITLGLSYTFAYLGEAPIDHTLHSLSGNLQGHYSSNEAHTVGLTLELGF
jgi:long-chain fatty acid transport protein